MKVSIWVFNLAVIVTMLASTYFITPVGWYTAVHFGLCIAFVLWALWLDPPDWLV